MLYTGRMKDLEQRVAAIESRNKKVEQDKAWETSWTRRLSIMTLTYFVVVSYLFVIDADKPFVSALVPAMGYLLSTLAMRLMRAVWQK